MNTLIQALATEFSLDPARIKEVFDKVRQNGKGLWRRGERRDAFLKALDRPKTTMELALDLRWPVKRTYDIARVYARRKDGRWTRKSEPVVCAAGR
jgi:hypothetical protein